MKTTTDQLMQVKRIFDRATWSGQFSHPHRVNGDEDKACRFLGTQLFSLKCLKEYVDQLDNSTFAESYKGNEGDIPGIIVALIADQVGQDRVAPRLYKRSRSGKPRNGWHLPESWIFEIII
jgi:hypothetical protein